jgi:hypothetical protein
MLTPYANSNIGGGGAALMTGALVMTGASAANAGPVSSASEATLRIAMLRVLPLMENPFFFPLLRPRMTSACGG